MGMLTELGAKLNKWVVPWVGGVFVISMGCASVEKSYRQAKILDTIQGYEDFSKQYPDNPYRMEIKDRAHYLMEKEAFRGAEEKNSRFYYEKYLQDFPQGKFADEGKKRVAESEEEAFSRTHRLGTIQAWQGFVEGYPKGQYTSEVYDRIQWLKRLKVGVLYLKSQEDKEGERPSKEISETIKKALETFPGRIVSLNSKSDPANKELSAYIEIERSEWKGSGPKISGSTLSGTLWGLLLGGPIGAGVGFLVGLGFDNAFGGSPRPSETWGVKFKGGTSVNDFEFTQGKDGLTFDEAIKYMGESSALDAVREAEIISWMILRDQPSRGFSKFAFESRNPYFRTKIIEILGRFAASPLEVVLLGLKDQEPMVQLSALKILGKIKDPRAVDPLLAAVMDGNNIIGEEAAVVLGEMGDPKAVTPLLAMLKEENKNWARGRIIKALGLLRDPRAVEPLLAALKDSDLYVRAGAAESLGLLRDQRATESLSMALGDQDWLVRKNAAEALGKVKDLHAVDPLIQALKSGDQNIYAVVESLGEIGDPRAIEPLIMALEKHGFSDVVQSIGKSLKYITGQDFGTDSALWKAWWEKEKITGKGVSP